MLHMGLLRGSFAGRGRQLLLGLPVLAVVVAGCSSSTDRQGAHSTNGLRPEDGSQLDRADLCAMHAPARVRRPQRRAVLHPIAVMSTRLPDELRPMTLGGEDSRA
jgi:hypothetical protein